MKPKRDTALSRLIVRGSLGWFLIALTLALTPAAALAAPPVITNTDFSGVTETAATLKASVDPSNANVEARFDYTTQAAFNEKGFEGAPSAPAGAIAVPSKVKGKGDIEPAGETITGVITTAGAFGPGQTIEGQGIPPGTTIVRVEEEAGTLVLKISQHPTETRTGVELIATGPEPVIARVEGLAPDTAYVFRAAAKKAAGANREEAQGPATSFSTFGPPPSFGPCPNDEFRSGRYAPAGHPGALLPDCRSFELATPLDKDGNNALSSVGYSRAAEDGGAITFGSTFGLPGGVGAQTLPFFQATRGAAGWSTSGLLPPATTGQEARFLVGQLPDLQATYAMATRLGSPRTVALLELHPDGAPPTQLTPYTAFGPTTFTELGFAGASADASEVVVEAATALPAAEGGPLIPGGVEGSPNVYAWQRSTGGLHLASVMNDGSAPPKGAYAGPYNITFEEPGSEGGTEGSYDLIDTHAVTEDGSVFFTARGTGHLYERINPTAPQSAVVHEGEPGEECTEPAKACTLDVSATHKTNGGPAHDGPDPAGEAPAAFQGATADGSQVLFTSSEKLTNDANTGPEEPPAQIGRATLEGEEPAGDPREEFIPTTHALGVAVDPQGEHLYWGDPTKGTISRANLDAGGDVVPGTTDAEFIVPGDTEAEVHQKSEPGVKTPAPTKPRYVAVGPCAGGGECVYWTNSGPPGQPPLGTEELPTVDGQGTIGRAVLTADRSAVEGEPEPEFITGASNPQGIAVNAEHIYWANAAQDAVNRKIGRANLGGSGVDQKFVNPETSRFPYGIALDSEYLYFAADESQNNHGYISRAPLAGGGQVERSVGEEGLRGVALDSGHLYWLSQKEGTIGRLAIGEWETSSNCATIPSCDPHFLTPSGRLEGLATDPSGSHLFWSTNGEAPRNPGADLYRFTPGAGPGGGTLTDLTPDPEGDGAEVRGVLGTSADGSYVYLAANADLDGNGPAEAGDCRGVTYHEHMGQCSIYLLHDGEFHLVGRVSTQGDRSSDATDWIPRPFQTYNANVYSPKSSIVSDDGRTLVFRSVVPQTSYDSRGVPELYRWTLGGGSVCISCTPTGEAPRQTDPARRNLLTQSLGFPQISPGYPGASQVQPRFVSADGDRVFFETPEALVSYDTDGASGCPSPPAGAQGSLGQFSCLDVYEWEAPGSGTCAAGGPGFSALNQGCLYLISQDSGSGPAFFAGASASGSDVFFFTTSRLVGSDTDELMDVYDAREGGGLVSQNTTSTPPCEGEGCRPAATPAPAFQSPPRFSGPGNPKPKPRKCGKGKVLKKGRCVARHPKKHRRHRGKKHHARHGQTTNDRRLGGSK